MGAPACRLQRLRKGIPPDPPSGCARRADFLSGHSALYWASMNEETDDRTALERVVSGDTEAFRILVDRYSDRLYRFCATRLGDADEAEDAVQDVFIRAYRSLSSFDPARGFAPWLFAIAANRVKSRYASRSAAGQLVEAAGKELLAGDGPAEASAEDGVLRDLAAAELRSALAGLPEIGRASCRERVYHPV